MAKEQKTEQDIAKDKLIQQGITDPATLEILTDQYAGMGGNYVFDPVTQKRKPT